MSCLDFYYSKKKKKKGVHLALKSLYCFKTALLKDLNDAGLYLRNAGPLAKKHSSKLRVHFAIYTFNSPIVTKLWLGLMSF